MKYKEQRMHFWQKEIPKLMESATAGTVTISTRLGLITGKITYIGNTKDDQNKVMTFYNIPFAKPPVGDLRFRKPVPYGSWTSTLDATSVGNQCMQVVYPSSQMSGVANSEDCLNLNIYVPKNVSSNAKRPVMVWVHGGGFTSGSAHVYDSGTLALEGDIIVVTIQYRIGIFGFFSLDRSEALGNYGIWDQMLALEWIHQNIDSFGGDPTSVTIFGESAGSASVSLLSLIPRNKNRFHRVIAQSGLISSSWGIANATEASYTIGEMTGCSKTLKATDFVRCLQNKDSSTLLNNFLRYTYSNPFAFPSAGEIGPVIDGDLIKLAPENLIKNYSSEEYKFFSSLDFITGTAKYDGSIVLTVMSESYQKHYGFNLTTGITPDEFCTVFVLPFASAYFKNNSLIFEAVCEKYHIKGNISQQSRQMIDMYTDFFFGSPAFQSLGYHSHANLQSNTFHYVFELNVPSVMLASPPPWYLGPGHADDLVCLFPLIPLTAQQEHLCSAMRKYWLNFAKSG
jgi:carboxylesterase type B